MIPARNLLRRHYDCYGGFFDDSCFGFEKPATLRSSEYMEEDPSRGGHAVRLENGEGEEEEEDEGEAEAGTSSRDCRECGDGWLQLGIGVGIKTSASRRSAPSSSSTTEQREVVREALSTELDLFASRPAAAAGNVYPTVPMNPVFVRPAQPAQHGVFYRHETPWGFWSAGAPAMGMALPAFPPPLPQYAVRRFAFPLESPAPDSGELRVVSPPRNRLSAGVWFMLQASQNQVREPFLPQIPKSYIRIKDGRMTVRLLKKYLASKLRLEGESEVGVWCRGHPLLPSLTLQHVRDNIWQARETATSLTLQTDSTAFEHLMILQYGRSL